MPRIAFTLDKAAREVNKLSGKSRSRAAHIVASSTRTKITTLRLGGEPVDPADAHKHTPGQEIVVEYVGEPPLLTLHKEKQPVVPSTSARSMDEVPDRQFDLRAKCIEKRQRGTIREERFWCAFDRATCGDSEVHRRIHLDSSKSRVLDPERRRELQLRLRSRCYYRGFLHAFPDYPRTAMPQLDDGHMQTVVDVCELIEDRRAYFGADLQRAFREFVLGNLMLRDGADGFADPDFARVQAHGGPNSGLFLLFAELGIAATELADRSPAVAAYSRLGPTLNACLEIFSELYFNRSRPSRRHLRTSYAAANFGGQMAKAGEVDEIFGYHLHRRGHTEGDCAAWMHHIRSSDIPTSVGAWQQALPTSGVRILAPDPKGRSGRARPPQAEVSGERGAGGT